MSDELIMSFAKESIIGAGFFYLLYYLIQNMEKISLNLVSFGNTLTDVSQTLTKIDMRMEQIEDRVQRLEQRM